MEPANRRPKVTLAYSGLEKTRAPRTPRRTILRTLAGLVLLATFHFPPVAKAEETAPNGMMPQCGPQMDGQVSCNAGVLYECEFLSPNSMERRTGWRWKPNILRSCPEPNRVKTREPIPIYERPPEDCYRERRDRYDDDDAATAPDERSEPRTMSVRPDGCRSHYR